MCPFAAPYTSLITIDRSKHPTLPVPANEIDLYAARTERAWWDGYVHGAV